MAASWLGRLALLFLAPAAAWLAGVHSTAVLLVVLASLAATAADGLRQRTKCVPFPIYILLLYALQSSSYIVTKHALVLTGDGGSDDGHSHGDSQTALASSTGSTAIRTMSIVMAAHNEHQYMKRTLESIYERTPKSILKEIIVVDDGSNPPLAPRMVDFPEVKILRHETRKGLIKSKTEGGNLASGDMIMFLDAHVKPEPHWAEPILKHMNKNYKRVVVPLIPILDGATWVTNNNAVGSKMMFDWTLFFNWFEDSNDIVPCMSGGLFGITKRWWHESGEYDYDMSMWGAENIEQSVRIWLCGGEIYVARDSRIAHVFRPHFPYKINNTEIYINKVRTVEAWFDEYKEQYYKADPAAMKFRPLIGDLSSRFALKKELHCKPFKWYIDKFKKVFKEKHMLPEDVFEIRDTVSGNCISSVPGASYLVEAPCNDLDRQQDWALQPGGNLRNIGNDLCLDANGGAAEKEGMEAFLYYCLPNNEMQNWFLTSGQVQWSGYCVQPLAADAAIAASAADALEGPRLKLGKCDPGFLQKRGPFTKHSERTIIE